MSATQSHNRSVTVSNPDKVFFPDAGITKGDLVDYYRRIAPVMLPHMADRPVTMARFPDGIEGEGFIQRAVPDRYPDWIARATLPKREGGDLTSVVCDSEETLVYIANQGCITPHVWLARIDKPEHPDRMIFDLDPSDEDFERVRKGARYLRRLLEDLGLPTFVMTTGSRGLHVVVPLDRSQDFEGVRALAEDVARVLARDREETLTNEKRKENRKDRVFLDTMRNSYGQSGVAPYAVRSKPDAPVAVPLDWDELDRSDLHPRRYTIRNVFKRLSQKADPWEDIDKQSASTAGASAQIGSR